MEETLLEESFFLKSDRLCFRVWHKNDLDLAVGLWGDHNVTRLFDSRGPLSDEQVKNRLYKEIETHASYGYQYWPIFLIETGEHIGCAGLRPYDLEKNTLEIGFHIRSSHWRNGYGSEAAKAVMKYAFNSLNASALFAGHHPQNIASRKLLFSLGFSYTHDEYYEPTGLDHPSYLLQAKKCIQ
jgi:RimJ/RimL family protein N-acetyltransferase